MRENEAIDLALKVHSRHILPAEDYEKRELTIIQVIADLYKAGYELVPRFKPNIGMGEIEKMKEEGVAY